MLSKNIAQVEQNRCVACGACTRRCPKEAIAVWKGCYAIVEEEKCVGCGICANICPVGCISKVARKVAES